MAGGQLYKNDQIIIPSICPEPWLLKSLFLKRPYRSIRLRYPTHKTQVSLTSASRWPSYALLFSEIYRMSDCFVLVSGSCCLVSHGLLYVGQTSYVGLMQEMRSRRRCLGVSLSLLLHRQVVNRQTNNFQLLLCRRT